MKKFLLSLLSAAAISPAFAGGYCFDHGPYLQDLAEDRCAVVFTTSAKGFSWVELENGDEPPKRFYRTVDGNRMADNTFNSIFIAGLSPATEYRYRLVSKEITNFVTSFVEFGDSICSPWYSFRTFDPSVERFSFIGLSDIHEDTLKLRRLLGIGDVDSCDMVFYIGDMQGHVTEDMNPWDCYLDTSVDIFASNKPFWFVRGNHETRGYLAPYYKQYFPSESDKYYRTLRYGNTAFLMLDCGEDKEDGHLYYAGMNDFSTYRSEQAEWLRKAIEEEEFRTARYRILMMHFPPADAAHGVPEVDSEHGIGDVAEKWLDILNSAGIDLAIVGHMHYFADIPARPEANRFPVLLNSNDSAARIDVDPEGITVRAFDSKGNTLLERKIAPDASHSQNSRKR